MVGLGLVRLVLGFRVRTATLQGLGLGLPDWVGNLTQSGNPGDWVFAEVELKERLIRSTSHYTIHMNRTHMDGW